MATKIPLPESDLPTHWYNIVPDLPAEESDELLVACRRHGLDLVFLLAPTSTDERIAAVAERASGNTVM